MDWIITNREWLFSGIGLVVLVFIIKFIRNFTKPESTIDNDLSIGYIEQGKFQDDYRSLLKLDNSNNDFSQDETVRRIRPSVFPRGRCSYRVV